MNFAERDEVAGGMWVRPDTPDDELGLGACMDLPWGEQPDRPAPLPSPPVEGQPLAYGPAELDAPYDHTPRGGPIYRF